MMLGLLLARAGVRVEVLEKHADFFRDFRGDTVHPSTLQLLHELGWLPEFLERPHQKATQVTAVFGDARVRVADLSHLPTECKFIVLMPQWDFLDFLAQKAKQYPSFSLRMQAKVTGLLREGERVVGVQGEGPQGTFATRADLVVAADGRHSTLRAAAGLKSIDRAAPIDVLWMRIPRKPTDPSQPQGRFAPGNLFVMIMRGDYWQCALVIPKGGLQQLQAAGLEALKKRLIAIEPLLHDRTQSLRSWDDIKLLTVTVDRLERWYQEGLLCIGDSAHAMSPIGGVGINLAVQDAVAAANLLWKPLREGRLRVSDLAAVQKRRAFPTKIIQAGQVAIQNRFLRRVLGSQAVRPPWAVRVLERWPFLSRIPARLIGIGPRPEHVRCPEII